MISQIRHCSYRFFTTHRISIVKVGPVQVTNVDFPVDGAGRRSPKFNTRLLLNGKNVHHVWLVYSISKNTVLCFCCKLLSNVTFSLGKSGSSDWKNMTAIISSHERSVHHVKAYLAWKELELRQASGEAIDVHHHRLLNQETEH
ncbi:zinc finger MYM-type protein 5-like [Hydra vulgaris]|uniref:zinc finger MYM-type protein 5-like n=1 Tax=Hydra vulgaris TaxID=6087 RepID=UPI001F5E7335|nr:zinc finger MYM-type protein 5-like [Hydra vulgaris]